MRQRLFRDGVRLGSLAIKLAIKPGRLGQQFHIGVGSLRHGLNTGVAPAVLLGAALIRIFGLFLQAGGQGGFMDGCQGLGRKGCGAMVAGGLATPFVSDEEEGGAQGNGRDRLVVAGSHPQFGQQIGDLGPGQAALAHQPDIGIAFAHRLHGAAVASRAIGKEPFKFRAVDRHRMGFRQDEMATGKRLDVGSQGIHSPGAEKIVQAAITRKRFPNDINGAKQSCPIRNPSVTPGNFADAPANGAMTLAFGTACRLRGLP
ncbi:hypothetical protein ABNQ38_16865 [Azospirillum sp. A29]|uniref:hypothetical protein n=1 Tax=Azospirillum sp. A29 TaxID=3160606 RepID=UPI00366D2786